MGIDEQSVKAQLTDLFKKTDNHAERIAAIEIILGNNSKMIDAINKSSNVMEKWVADAHRVLYGDERIGVAGLVKQHNKMWIYTQRILIAGAVGVYLLKELNLLDKLA